MDYRILGHSGLKVSQISFGCMSLGSNQKENDLLIHQAIDEGINFFDTADMYAKGQNEITLGKALGEKRGDVFVASKVGNVWNEDGVSWHWNATKSHITSAIDKSLQRLGTDYLDLYQLHGGMIEDNIDETIEAFELLIEQGKIRHYGISSIRPNVIRAFVEKSNMTSVMMQYSLLDRRPEETIFELLQKNNIGVLARGSLAQGVLVDKPARDYLDHPLAEVQKLKDAISQLGSGASVQMTTALQFVLSNPAISTAVVGISKQVQWQDLIHFLQHPATANEEMKKIFDLLDPNIYSAHR